MDESAVYTVARWQVRAGNMDSVLQALSELAQHSRAEAGCLIYEAHRNVDDLHQIVLYEGYRSQAALKAHRESEHFQRLVLNTIVPLLQHREVVQLTALPL